MDAETLRALKRVNQEFYERHALAFSASRRGPWRGWRRVVEVLVERRPDLDAPRVLDAGCGNGRFAELLAARFGPALSYLGVDASAALLEEAARRSLPQGTAAFLRLDMLEGEERRALAGREFNLIAAFGLLHHVPGQETRAQLLAALAGLLARRGLLALSFWDFARAERLRQRIVPWSRLAARGGPDLDPAMLEPGDHLLAFGRGEEALRYCHVASPTEQRELVAALPLAVVADFRADGREGSLNRYVVAERLAP